MRPDLIIRGGFVVDGSGRPGFEADVAVADGRIIGVGRYDGGSAAEVIDARGKLVTPGFIDIHTHLDAQITWDALGAPSCYHGVTSVVMGNCGVGFAPCRAADRDYLMFLMEGVEDVPRAAMAAGIPWAWESFGEYYRYLDSIPIGLNVGAHVGHCALRIHAMGERGATEEHAGPDDLAAMQRALREAMAAGALGVSTSRTTGHKTPAGDAVPGTFADPTELHALAAVLAECNAGVFELAPFGAVGEAAGGTLGELGWMEDVARASRRPVMFGLVQNQNQPLTFDPALLYGIRGRGLVRRGWSADLNVIDLDRLGVCEPEVRHDFPTGARHLSQRANGYAATIVNGRVVMRDGVHTGALPGRLLRNEA